MIKGDSRGGSKTRGGVGQSNHAICLLACHRDKSLRNAGRGGFLYYDYRSTDWAYYS